MIRIHVKYRVLIASCLGLPLAAAAQHHQPWAFSFHSAGTRMALLFLLLLVMLGAVLLLQYKVRVLLKNSRKHPPPPDPERFRTYLDGFTSRQLDELLQHPPQKDGKPSAPQQPLAWLPLVLLTLSTLFSSVAAVAQTGTRPGNGSFATQPGVIITVILVLLPILAGILVLFIKARNLLQQHRDKIILREAAKLAGYLQSQPADELDTAIRQRKAALDYQLTHTELSGTHQAADQKGLLAVSIHTGLPVVPEKKKALKRPDIDPRLSKLIRWYLVCATGWLLLGTTFGEYLGIKFVAPDADHLSWLSFGRLRPVHTNMVFWGWASLGMLGLGYYIVPRVSNTPLASMKKGWWALFLINAAVLAGTICLMAGINNGGGEYREYIWPVMLLFGIGLALTLINFLQTIARRTTREIYIANWYIVAATIFAIVIALVAYLPWWQNGLGETIIQGYYMHQGVGMWFMLFTLGIVYYFLPQQLNKPIYSYSLGILAFWTQILFYTLIGTHHFVFSAIPWWLQTVAIVGSGGMVIPVIAGTTNFLMTFKGAWYKIGDSYTLPFFLVGIIFYFTGSLQGTAEAFRSTNMVWHFTDFTVAHSHITMYGIICFFLWAAIYAVLPRLTGKEAPQITIGAHFWLALIGLLFYAVPLMYGSTLKGLLWMDGKPFTDGLVLMAPYWLWRAIGGSLMWLSHLFFAYNMYQMLMPGKSIDIKEEAINKIKNASAGNA
ncbi:MAG: cbb3-type cytochrome c oxidase subunit I [Bacteroidota bacterium]